VEKASDSVEKSIFNCSAMKLSSDEKRIYDHLSKEPVHLEQIITNTEMAPGSVNASLISLRLKGLIKQSPGNLFSKNL
jgi:DNA processing protein